MEKQQRESLLRRLWTGYGTSTLIAALWVIACMLLLNFSVYLLSDAIYYLTPWTASGVRIMGASVIFAAFMVHLADLVREKHPLKKPEVPQ